ncbi:MAG: HNH endonuclease signature motif containing protein [Candidatus Limnocylindrales bacterium]
MTHLRGRAMKGCLSLLVVFALLAWPIEQLQQLFGWSDSQTGDLLLVAVALLAIGASVRGRADRRRAPETTLRGSRLASGLRQAAVARLGEARAAGAALARARYRIPPAQGLPAQPNVRPRDLPMSPRWERRDRRFSDSPPGGGGTQVRPRMTRARDPLPAQLRFSVLQRDGFRCRYCGRTSREPGVVLHVDHVVPLVAGGATTEDNLLTACEECNLGKATRAVVSVGT